MELRSQEQTTQPPATEDSGHRPAWITLGILFAAAAYLSILVFRPFTSPLIAGALLAVLFHPLHQWLLRRMPERPSIAAFITTSVVVIAFVLPVAAALSLVVQQLRAVLVGLGADGINESAERIWDSVAGPLDAVAGWFGSSALELREALMQRLREAGSAGVQFTVALVGGVSDFAIKGTIVALTLFFALRDGAAFTRSIVSRSPLGKNRTWRLLTAAEDTIVASFYGVIAVALVQGALCWLGCWIAGLPHSALWGFGGTVASVLPVFGSALVWVPAAIYLFTQGSIGMGIFLLVWGTVVIANSDNVVRPLVLMARVPANPLLVLITILGGIQAFGLLGILLGPVVLGVTLTLIDLIREEIDGDAEVVKGNP